MPQKRTVSVNIEGLHNIFHPASVAVFGVDDRQASPGRGILTNLLSGGFKGRIYPIYPGIKEVAGLRSHPDLQAVGESVDLAVLNTPLEMVPAAIEACGGVGVSKN